jgi:hypothetical protein
MFKEFCYEFGLRAHVRECDPFCCGLYYCGGQVVLCYRIGVYRLNGFVKCFRIVFVIYQDLFYGVIFFSSSVSLSGYVISRLTRYLIAACLCSGRWLESFGLMMWVAVGFI